ncbi:PQQ-binding-like beta-propeller repeat protein [Bacteroidota bacterium]
MMPQIISGLLLFILFPWASFAQPTSGFKGPERNGNYTESGLLKSWPDEGPEQVWHVGGLGNGYSSPAVTSDRLFITGEKEGMGYLFSFDLQGKLLWQRSYGPEWMVSYSGPRATPVVAGNQVYVLSGKGKIASFEQETGDLNWSLEMLKELNGSQVFYGFSESFLIDGDTLYCLPGGIETNVVALNRHNGEIFWVSAGTSETAGYISPVVAHLPSRDLLIGMTEYSIYGLDKSTGKLLCTYDMETELDLACNYPIVEEGAIYYATGPGNGTVKLEITPEGESVEQVWKNSDMDTYFGGFVKIGNHLYGSSSRQRDFLSIDCQSGETVSRLDFLKGAVIFFGGMIYIYNERGRMGLISVDNGEMEVVSSFQPESGTREPFAFPVIDKGILYLRHGNVLMAYDIREE